MSMLAAPIVDLLPYQQRMVTSPARFTWNNWSRQVGKSFTFALRRLLRGIERSRLQVMLSAGERQSKELMEKVRMHCQALKIASEFNGDATFEGTAFKQLELTIPGKCRIIALPANPNTARGFTGDVFLDEFAMHQHDREIWAALFPTVMRGQGELDIASTPKGKSNMFARLAQNEQFARSTVTIETAVADGLKVDPEELRLALGDDDLWRQEFLCEFLDEAEAFLTYEQIAACEDMLLDPPLTLGDADVFLTRATTASNNCFLGLDIGRFKDLTVFWLLERVEGLLKTRAVLAIQDVPFREQWELLHETLGSRKVRRCCIDAGGLGMPLAEAAVEAFGSWTVEPVTFTLQIKEELAGRLRIAIEDRTIRIPVSADIRNDWHSVRRTPTPGGHFKYQAERDEKGHADRFWAAALAVRAAGSASGPMEYVGSADKLKFAREGIW